MCSSQQLAIEGSCRIATDLDLAAILRMYSQPDFDARHVLSLGGAERISQRKMTYPDYAVYVAVHCGEIIGAFALLIMHSPSHTGTSIGIVEDVVIHTDYLGQGVGRLMMNHAYELSREKRLYKLVLSSNLSDEITDAFYAAMRFEQQAGLFDFATRSNFRPGRRSRMR